ncbi:MAG: hypothetical protein HQK75_10605 [Candidatus Magnetomorum sp.]|nr:hypothetical protein [Candidatus Magnetomorum sp.]
MSKIKIPDKLKIWIDVRKRFHLSDAQIQMARELGLNPKKFGKLANHKQQPWKEPLPDYIETLYYKRFKKNKPEQVRSIERMVKDKNKKKQERKLRKQAASSKTDNQT